MLGEVCERCDRLDHAEQYAREALGLDPAHTKAIRLLAHVQRRRGELPAARDLLLQQLRRSPGAEDWRLRSELTAVLDRLGEYDEAMRELILAKEQLRSFASPFVEEARAVRTRQLEIAQQFTKSDLATWAAAINSVRPRSDAPIHPVRTSMIGHDAARATSDRASRSDQHGRNRRVAARVPRPDHS